MLSKLSLSAFLSTAALTGAVLVSTMTPGFSCPYGNRTSPTDTITSSNPSSLTDHSVNFDKPDLNKLGIAGGSLATLLGLYAGGMFLKARLTKQNESDLAEVPQTIQEAQTIQEEGYKALSTFPIVVPAEALARDAEDEAAEEIASTR